MKCMNINFDSKSLLHKYVCIDVCMYFDCVRLMWYMYLKTKSDKIYVFSTCVFQINVQTTLMYIIKK
jgi:hypothetical protein